MKARTRPSDAAVRTMHLVALDATALVRRLQERQHEMLSAFSRLRDREGLLGAMRNFGLTARFEDLAVLAPEVQREVASFYELVDELRWYFQFTTDMPGALADRFTAHRLRLQAAHERLAQALELATEPPTVDVSTTRVKAAPRRAAAAKKR